MAPNQSNSGGDDEVGNISSGSWEADPTGRFRWRWRDATGDWTDQVSGADRELRVDPIDRTLTPRPGPSVSSESRGRGRSKPPLYRRWWMLGVYGFISLVVLVGACADTESDDASVQDDASDEPNEDASAESESSANGDTTNSLALEAPANTVPAPITEAPATTAAPPEDESGAVEQSGSDGGGSGATGVEVAAGSEGAVAELLSRLEALPVRAEQRSGYDRDLFDHWVDADGDRCDARREVLIAEAVVVPRVGSSCSLSGGQWYSVYDGATETGTGSGFDVDHLVPLAEAWDSGAYGWDSDTRRRYANDLGYEHSLVAVSASSNRQKGASDPAEWLPVDTSVRCWYVEAWIAVKTRWELSVDTTELQALRQLISQCDDSQLGGAPSSATPVAAPATTSAPATSVPTVTGNGNCHPAYEPCLEITDDLNCGDLSSSQKPVTILEIGEDPYRLDGNRDGVGCTS